MDRPWPEILRATPGKRVLLCVDDLHTTWSGKASSPSAELVRALLDTRCITRGDGTHTCVAGLSIFASALRGQMPSGSGTARTRGHLTTLHLVSAPAGVVLDDAGRDALAASCTAFAQAIEAVVEGADEPSASARLSAFLSHIIKASAEEAGGRRHFNLQAVRAVLCRVCADLVCTPLDFVSEERSAARLRGTLRGDGMLRVFGTMAASDSWDRSDSHIQEVRFALQLQHCLHP